MKIQKRILNKLGFALRSDENDHFPHVYSPFGIPGDKFSSTKSKIKIIIDPTPKYFKFQMRSDVKKYEKTLLIHGCEPPEMNDIKKELIEHGGKFTKVYSFDKDVLNKVKGSELFSFGSCWVVAGKKDYVNNFTTNKKFKLSFIKSSKRDLPGHQLRYDIESLFDKKYNFEVLYPKQRIEGKDILFNDSMFHVAIENTQHDNYFTEKLIDCFMSYTIPIYWGCSNASDYFDPKGIIAFHSKNELESILNNLTPEDYTSRVEALEKNYEIAKEKYAFFFERIDELIQKL